MYIINELEKMFPHLRYRSGKSFSWSPETNEIFYDSGKSTKTHSWSLLHETGHALLGHNRYDTDLELIKLEIAAWEKAKEVATSLKITINENHIQDCLDTYRDWLYQRSVCPRCDNKSLQQETIEQYQCFNCHMVWEVTPSRFCRAYRATKHAKKSSAVFYATDNS